MLLIHESLNEEARNVSAVLKRVRHNLFCENCSSNIVIGDKYK